MKLVSLNFTKFLQNLFKFLFDLQTFVLFYCRYFHFDHLRLDLKIEIKYSGTAPQTYLARTLYLPYFTFTFTLTTVPGTLPVSKSGTSHALF